MIDRYIVDTNALSHITERRRKTAFFLDHCIVPEMVVDECTEFPDYEFLKARQSATTFRQLKLVTAIMEKVPTNDTSLINLYKGLGSADPFIIACALEHSNRFKESLFPDSLIIVSNDTAVVDLAKQYNFPTISGKQLAALIDSQTSN